MAEFKVTGLEELGHFFDMATLPDEVADEMLNAEADIVVRAQKETAESMLQGEYATGEVAESITKSKVLREPDVRKINILFEGERERGNAKEPTRNAEIAFINEYGKTGQPARPFIRMANEKCADEAVEAAGRIFGAWIDKL